VVTGSLQEVQQPSGAAFSEDDRRKDRPRQWRGSDDSLLLEIVNVNKIVSPKAVGVDDRHL